MNVFTFSESPKIPIVYIFPNPLISDEAAPSAPIYLRANELCEKLIKWSIILVDVAYFVPTISLILGGIVFYKVNDGYVETTNLYLPLKLK